MTDLKGRLASIDPEKRLYALRELCNHSLAARQFDRLEQLLTDIFFLEAKTEAGMVFALATDFSNAVAVISEDRPRHRILRLLEEAIRRDIHFVARHAEDYPQTLFQCLWNSCWWYDLPEAKVHYHHSSSASQSQSDLSPLNLCRLSETWLHKKRSETADFTLLRSLRPPTSNIGAPLHAVLQGHTASVNAVVFSPDGNTIASASSDGTVRIWQSDSGQLLSTLECNTRVLSAAYSSNGAYLACGTGSPFDGEEDNLLRVWNVATSQELFSPRKYQNTVSSVAFSPCGRLLATGSYDKTVRIWDITTPQPTEVLCLRGHANRINCISFCPNGRLVASASGAGYDTEDNTIRVWDLHLKREIRCLRGHMKPVNSVAFCPDGLLLVSGSGGVNRPDDDSVRVWEVETGQQLLCLQSAYSHVHCVTFEPGSRTVVAGSGEVPAINSPYTSGESAVQIWNIADGRSLSCLFGHEAAVLGVSFSPNGQWLASASADCSVRVWNVSPGMGKTLRLRGHEGEVTSLAFSADGSRIASGSADETVVVWDTQTAEPIKCLRGHRHDVRIVALSSDGKYIASGGWDSSVRLWDMASGRELACLLGQEHEIFALQFSPNNKYLASLSAPQGFPHGGSQDKWLWVWDVEKRTALWRTEGHEELVNSVAFCPHGQELAAGCTDNTVRVYSIRVGEEIRRLDGHEKAVHCLSYASDAGRLASGSADGTIRVWDLEAGREILRLTGHHGTVYHVVFSDDGRRIVSGANDGTVRVWDVMAQSCSEVIQGSGDTAAIARCLLDIKCRAVVRGAEMVVEDALKGIAIAHFPGVLHNLRTHPSGRMWAGSRGRHVYLVCLEGKIGSKG